MVLLRVKRRSEGNALFGNEVQFGEKGVDCGRGLDWRIGDEETRVDVQEVVNGEATAAAAGTLHWSQMDAVVSALSVKREKGVDKKGVEKNAIPAMEVSHASGDHGLDAQTGGSELTSIELNLPENGVSSPTAF